MKFSDSLWQANEQIYQSIIKHPFNIELMEGTLDENRFHFYLEQDAHYLIQFSRALAFIAARATSTNIIEQFLNCSLGVLVAERQLHDSFLRSNCDHISPSPACMAYCHYLIAIAASGSLEEAIAAVLPCFWIYREVGCQIFKHAVPSNPYRRWIENYSSPEFSEVTDRAICLLDEFAEGSSAKTLEKMKGAFENSTLFEWHFWNDAYNMILFRDSIPLPVQSPGD